MVTRNDVAKRANVAPCVVSYVLNNSNYVSIDKRNAVLEAIKELNYIPNQMAKNLKNNTTFQLAVVRGSAINDMFNDLLYNLENIALKNGYTISLMTVVRDESKLATESYINMLIGRKFDAIFIANSSMSEKHINRLVANGVPVLLYTTRDYIGLDERVRYLAPDYRKGVKLLIEYLIKRGHRRIAFIPNIMYPSPMSSSNHRFTGYVSALEEFGIPVNTKYIGDETETLEEVKKSITKLFDKTQFESVPTAIYVDESVVAGIIMKHLNSLGYRVPEDVSIVSSSDSTVAKILTPALTDVGVDTCYLANKATEMMIDLIKGNYPEHCTLGMHLNERESTRIIDFDFRSVHNDDYSV